MQRLLLITCYNRPFKNIHDLDVTQNENVFDLEVSPSAGGGRCVESVTATGPAPEAEARPGRPWSGSGSGGAEPGCLTPPPPPTGRERNGDPEPGRARTEPAVGTARLGSGSSVHRRRV